MFSLWDKSFNSKNVKLKLLNSGSQVFNSVSKEVWVNSLPYEPPVSDNERAESKFDYPGG